MVAAFITFGGILFWLLTAIAIIISIVFMSNQRTGKAIFALFVYLALIVLFTNADLFGWIKTNWEMCLYGAAAYLAVGVVYMLVRWQIFSSKVAGFYERIRDAFLLVEKDPNVLQTPDGKERLARRVENDINMRSLNAQVPLLVRRNKARLSTWVAFWPISAAEYLLGDLLVDMVNGIVRTFSGMMQRMSDRKFSKFNELN